MMVELLRSHSISIYNQTNKYAKFQQTNAEIKTINMNINYNWVISSMEEYPKTADDLTDVVCIVHWRRVATVS